MNRSKGRAVSVVRSVRYNTKCVVRAGTSGGRTARTATRMSNNDDETLREQPLPWRRRDPISEQTALALVIAWSLDEPLRVGEVAFIPDDGLEWVLGRGRELEGQPRVLFGRLRPGPFRPSPPLTGPGISRNQLLIRAQDDCLEVQQVGRCSMSINTEETSTGGELRAGDTLLLTNQLLLLCVSCPRHMPSGPRLHTFGEPDDQQIVGESPASWQLRSEVAFAASSDAHVLILGQSGTGKELAARAVHAMSKRAKRPLVARSAATFPSTLIDAELFGNARDYPNAGMPERPGLVGEADGSTLFLDEIGEMPVEIQAHLLRVLDEGEYQRLGETGTRRSDFRLVAATNRDASQLKHDLLARLRLRIAIPPLDERRQDIPLLARHLLRANARNTPELARFFQGPEQSSAARMDPLLVDHLLRRQYPLNVRDLDSALWTAIAGSRGELIEMTAKLGAGSFVPPDSEGPAPAVTAEQIEEALVEHRGNISAAYKALGLPSRYALYRLIKAHRLEGATRHRPAEPSAEAIQSSLAEHDGNVNEAASALGLKNRYALYRLMKKHDIERLS